MLFIAKVVNALQLSLGHMSRGWHLNLEDLPKQESISNYKKQSPPKTQIECLAWDSMVNLLPQCNLTYSD